MGPQLFLLALLLIKCTEHVEGNSKTYDTSLKLGKHHGSAVGNPVISEGAGAIRKFPGRLCKCEGNGRWEEDRCPCAKSARRNNRRARKMRKMCQKQRFKHAKKCLFIKKTQRKHGPIVPI